MLSEIIDISSLLDVFKVGASGRFTEDVVSVDSYVSLRFRGQSNTGNIFL